MSKKVAIYCRVSTVEQAEEGYSIDEVANIVAFGFFKRYKLDAFHFIILINIVKLLVCNAYAVVCGSKESLVSPF